MTAAVFIGCSFIAFGPALALCVCTIAAEPLRLLFLIAGGFFWLVSLLLSSLVWFIAVQIGGSNNASVKKNLLIFGVMVSVLLQEVFRFAYYKLLKKANKGLMTISQEETLPISVRQLSYVSGLGFGIMSGVFSLVNILTDSWGPGTVGIYGDSPQYFLSSGYKCFSGCKCDFYPPSYLFQNMDLKSSAGRQGKQSLFLMHSEGGAVDPISCVNSFAMMLYKSWDKHIKTNRLAFMTLAIVLLHIFWGIVFFDACEKKKWWALALVILSHLLVSDFPESSV
ncbi:gamma-secretase subunit APH-1B isoform X2 [Chrysemys picta bellii]|uniref:gamma-secretase subunit APH-1B isoform X2 n=1 Tax=Chrysemys picta bellii TaxID=8478 RepID=UPI0032B2004C